MSKKNASRLTAFRKTKAERRSGEILTCMDEAADRCRAVATIAGLLEACKEARSGILEPETVGDTGTLILDELERLRAVLRRLEKLVP